ncbi:TPA: hypothetical protein PXM11_003754 [Yersinia enterocolitica]|uniref:phage neck terminator protein n=1 Tax=Yersinia enterocolitica TaxID=630 RepID=UPI0032FB2F10|nr:hypothetical protein [Yersinia enterocolitica]HDL6972377.1 hypothetical protein [Yersinia enterocolitica]HDL6976090.1 hypothetical protein [Yersinia enterocolitica]HDL6989002.1 hypothetical protein [Yersinia enterocolitica]HDL6997663.1 hypothetical protein [Yersinia enterocolitica]
MSASVDVTEDDLTTALRGFLLSLISGEIVVSQENLVSTPLGEFCTMTSLGITRLSTNRKTYHDTGNPVGGTSSDISSAKWRCQLDFYGDSAHDNANIISTMMRSDYACEKLKASGIEMQPLYADEPHNTTMINGEQQYESRWTMDAHFQFNPVITTPMEFADELNIGLVEIDAKYPPGA